MSRVIHRPRGNEEFRSWQPPVIAGQATGAASAAEQAAGAMAVTAGQIEQVQRQAYEEGFALGRRDGFAAGRAQVEEMLKSLAEPFAGLEQAAMDELISLIRAVAQQLVRRELKTSPGEIVAVVREALAVLPSSARDIRVHLHPEDAAFVREALALSGRERGWRIVEDPGQGRGGCRVCTDASRVDAGVDARLNAVIARLLGGERADDR